MSNFLLEARGIDKSYGRIQVLKNVDISIAPGEAHVVIGPNGAGKTTLFKVLSGEVFPNNGSITFAGKDVTADPGWQRVRSGIGRTFQSARIFSELTPFENMVVAVEAHERVVKGKRPLFALRPTKAVRDTAAEILEDFALTKVAKAETKSLSHGDKKRLELAMAVAGRPQLLMLDEPTAGMAPGDRQKCVELIDRLLKKGGFSLLLTEHDMAVVFGLATRISVLNYGQVIASGTPEEIRSNARVREVYLGHDVSSAA
ncbi:ABC transporter ATP-binding protein [Aminobacter aminovorans]|uniref:Branched-chain amino acid ABC transporter ATPase n=1 Tax=Aminobacter aminovorans TaxID=83263 RepID=A0AAC9ATR0_AMIAI|nr:ABC transporter ATP-binding protein [Aminobacter aminovorans]AMS45508.1 branched-chain amino acid ABC transporter ATPase [Aminobacter aminovorans]MBB3708583.1 branched-chain amino acid transport system ATP-binding protein [Aminobacter aminovorans]